MAGNICKPKSQNISATEKDKVEISINASNIGTKTVLTKDGSVLLIGVGWRHSDRCPFSMVFTVE